jgi:hypothetical protein
VAYKKKFKKGKPIRSLDELIKQNWVMWGDSPRHMGFIGSMQMRTVDRLMQLGYFSYAIDVSEVEDAVQSNNQQNQQNISD